MYVYIFFIVYYFPNPQTKSSIWTFSPPRLFSPRCCTAMLMRAVAIWSNCPAWHSAKCQKRFCLVTKTVLISVLFLSVGGEYRFITPQRPPEMTFLTLFFGVRLEADKPDNVCLFSFFCEGSLRNPFLHSGSFFSPPREAEIFRCNFTLSPTCNILVQLSSCICIFIFRSLTRQRSSFAK